MSNVVSFQQALLALNARKADRAAAAATLRGFDAVTANEKVRQAQVALNAAGFPAGAADGLWGPNTLQAVRNFRAAAGLNPDPPQPTPVGRSMPQPGWIVYLDAAFDAALQKAMASKGAAPGAAMPLMARVHEFLLAPSKPVYKKPILWIGVGVVALTIVLALRKRD